MKASDIVRTVENLLHTNVDKGACDLHIYCTLTDFPIIMAAIAQVPNTLGEWEFRNSETVQIDVWFCKEDWDL